MTGRGAEELAQAFEAQRPRLLRVAYATIGSLAEAEDCVQETWLRLRRTQDRPSIRDLRAWLTTTVGRLDSGRPRQRPRAKGALRRPVAARAAGRAR